MGLKTYHNISGIYCDSNINDDNSGNPAYAETLHMHGRSNTKDFGNTIEGHPS